MAAVSRIARMLGRALLSGAAWDLPGGACRECVSRDMLLVALADSLAALGTVPLAWSVPPCGCTAPPPGPARPSDYEKTRLLRQH
jgi:hypothetical protein